MGFSFRHIKCAHINKGKKWPRYNISTSNELTNFSIIFLKFEIIEKKNLYFSNERGKKRIPNENGWENILEFSPTKVLRRYWKYWMFSWCFFLDYALIIDWGLFGFKSMLFKNKLWIEINKNKRSIQAEIKWKKNQVSIYLYYTNDSPLSGSSPSTTSRQRVILK